MSTPETAAVLSELRARGITIAGTDKRGRFVIVAVDDRPVALPTTLDLPHALLASWFRQQHDSAGVRGIKDDPRTVLGRLIEEAAAVDLVNAPSASIRQIALVRADDGRVAVRSAVSATGLRLPHQAWLVGQLTAHSTRTGA